MFRNVLIILGVMLSSIYSSDYSWIESTQQDFKDGIFEHKLYVSNRLGGAIEFVTRFDLNNDGYIDLFVAGIPSNSNYIYWGDTNGYSLNRRTTYPGNCGGNCDAADLNCDGYPEFLSTRYHEPNIWIHWGTNVGPDPNNTTVLNMVNIWNETSIIADFNKDGYLDIVVGSYDTTYAAVFFGSSSGYSSSNRDTFSVTPYTAFNLVVADFNKDNWLDLLIVNATSSSDFIYWGSINGFSASNSTGLPYQPSEPHGAATADLNNDGWLDLVLTGNYNIDDAYIYWGSSAGYQTHQVLYIGYPVFGGSSINDFNDDGYLDILFFFGDGRSYSFVQKPRIYWGSINGYSNQNWTEIGIPVNASSGFVADLNYDGNLDVYTCNFAVGSSYGSSYVFWGTGFNTNQIVQHPGTRNHHAMARDVGNTYNRQYYEEYQSSVFDAGFPANWEVIDWSPYLPTGTEIKVFLRSGNSSYPDSTWQSWVEVFNGGNIPDSLDAQYIQYMAKLIFTNPAYLPRLDSIRISYQSIANDVGVMGIIAPIGIIDSNEVVIPKAMVKNYGSNLQSFPVIFRIGTLYIDTQNVANLNSGDSILVNFSAWTVAQRGTYYTKCSTALIGDQNLNNNALYDSFTIRVCDVGVARIIAPIGNINYGQYIIPTCSICNYGSSIANYLVRMKIGDFYNETVRIIAHLPNTFLYVTFPNWTALQTGTYIVSCSTELVGDVNLTNDQQINTVTVLPQPSPWIKMANILTLPSGKRPKSGSSMAGLEATGKIYFLKASNTSDFYSYTPNTSLGLWTELIPMPDSNKEVGDGKKPKKGASIAVYETGKCLFALRGNNTPGFWKYQADTLGAQVAGWSKMANIPSGQKNPKDASGLVAVPINGADYIFVMKGSRTDEFYLYDITNNTWAATPTKPSNGNSGKFGYKKGSCLTWDGDSFVYVLKGNYGDFFKYNLYTGFWTELRRYDAKYFINRNGKKKKPKDGAALVYYDGAVYMLKGGNTNEFWMYDIVADTWIQMGPTDIWDIPIASGKKVKGGGCLTRLDDYFYAAKGANTPEFYRHALPIAVPSLFNYQPANEGTMENEMHFSGFKLVVAPNPAFGITTVRYNLPIAEPMMIRLYNISGVLIKSYTKSTPKKEGSLIINVKELSAGIYILRFESGNTKVTKKLVLEK